MPNIQINIKDKVARADRVIIVCDNSDYTAVFDFDDEWSAYDTKTARFAYCGKYTDVVFTGNSCPIPVIQDTRSLTIGVYAGDLHTTTPAYVSCVPSILCGNGIPADPTPDVYNQLMELLNEENGIWYPAVDDAGNMSWTRSMSETEPQPVNIKGQNGKDYVLTDADKQEIAKTAAGLVDVPSVQPDWNQNDSTAADYIKNRPFYTGNPVETVLVEESTVTFAKNGSLYGAMFPTTFEATVGNIYKVSWDGSDYECTCVDFNSYGVIGNLSIPGAGSDTGEPFIMVVNNGVAIQIITADTSASHTFSISGFVVSITKIGAKYIPKLPYMDKVNPTGTGAFSLNRKTDTTVGEYSFAEGYQTTASGGYSHAEGRLTTASGDSSHAEGRLTTASGYYSHAEGQQTMASGYYSHAEGHQTMASGDYSHAEGDKTKASSKLQHVQGKYNIEDATNTYAHIVGNGDNITRSNAHTLDWSGNAWFAGTVEGTALILPSSTAGSTKKFKITVDDSGAPTITNESDSTNTWKPTNLPTVTASDTGKFLRVSDTGEWVAETILSASGVSF